MPLLVEDEIGEAEDVARQLARGAPEDGLGARDELGEAERLRDVVVAARAERLDLVLGRVLRGQEEDGGLEAALPQAAADLDPLDVGQHPVEHDEVGLEARDRAQGLPTGLRLLDRVALVAERGRDGVDDRRLVVDDEDLVLAHAPILARVPVNRLRIQGGPASARRQGTVGN